ncbi:MAG: hypothetical protein LBQ79_02160 [Deltaproteobacteria bacterium]|nr:hypothetical protein [Deltaproteobacteria bacterium]
MSTFSFIMLSLLTCFVYYYYWVISLGYNVNRSGRLANRVNTKLLIASGTLLAWTYVTTYMIYSITFPLTLQQGMNEDALIGIFAVANLSQNGMTFIYFIVNAIAFVTLAFRLREYFQNSGINAPCSGIAAFFFNGFYIYYAVRRANRIQTEQGTQAGYFQPPLVNPQQGYQQGIQPPAQPGFHQQQGYQQPQQGYQPPRQGYQQPQQGYQQPQQGYQQPQQGYQQPQQGYQQPQQGYQQPQQGYQQPQQGYQQPQGQPAQPAQPGGRVDVTKGPGGNR